MRTFTADGLLFDVSDDGPSDGRVVVALHGFPEDRHCWRSIAGRLVAEGYRVLTPDQRGYSPGARPKGRRSYTVDRLAGDVLALADTAGARRFDLLGHDWGAAVAWELAARHPERVRSLAALSVPHPGALGEAMRHGGQLRRSWYMLAFQVPAVPETVLRLAGPDRAARALERDGLDGETARRYGARMASPAAVGPAINWYRAVPLRLRHPTPAVRVPVLYMWGDRDRYVTRSAAERNARYVEAAYRFEVLEGASHWLPTAAADRVWPALVAHLDQP